MGDKLTAVKIKYPNGTYSEQILLSVLAENVQVNSTATLLDALDLIDARIDQIVAPTSSTLTLDEEVRDIRVGKDATRTTTVNYASAGTAVRTQLDEMRASLDYDIFGLKSAIDERVVKYINYSIVENEYADKNTGQIISYNDWDRTNYIEVDNSKTLYIYNGSNNRTAYCAQYTQDETPLETFTVELGWNKIHLLSTCSKIIISSARRFETVNKLIIINDLSKKINSIPFHIHDNIIINTKWINGSLDDTGAIVEAPKRLVSDYIELEHPNTELHVELKTWRLMIYEYDKNKNLVYRPQGYYTQNYKIITRPETKYIRMIVNNTLVEYLYPDDIYDSDLYIYSVPIVNKLKVMTYNVGHYAYGTGMGLPENIYDEKLKNYRRFLGDQNIDIIGVQEFDSWMNDADTTEEAIKANDVLWDHYYPYEKSTGVWGSIKSKEFMWWSWTRQLSTDRYYVIGYINGICLLSVHLSVGVANTQVRLNEADEIISILENEERFIMFGDFNCEPGEEDELYAKFTNAGYNIANCGWFGKYYTWSNVRADFDDYDNPTGTKIYYLDNVITSNNIKITNVYPIPKTFSLLSSDHIPLVAELEIS